MWAVLHHADTRRKPQSRVVSRLNVAAVLIQRDAQHPAGRVAHSSANRVVTVVSAAASR